MTRLPVAVRALLEPIRRRLRPTEIEARVAAVGLREGDIAIDCGANIGLVTAAFARTGADVHAFEPNPDAFAVLEERFRDAPNVRLHRVAVLDRPGAARLHLHVDAARDPVGASIGSSVLSLKGNVDPESYVEVEAIDLSQFVLDLDRDVRVLKIDIEGAECPVVHRLLDTGA
ncbi:MAG: FkbM family methyltransferase, partial [Gaiellaceae bacterium]